MKSFTAELQQRREQSLYRSRRVVDGACDPVLRMDGRDVLSFCSNDYLGLANDPRVVEAMCEGAREYGVGSGAAHLISGHSRAHHQLEEELAEFTGRERALLFSTGYMANLGIISALAGRSDTVVQDRLNHASLIDASQLSGSKLLRYAHNDIDDLQRRLEKADGQRLIVTDGVFSMDGDIAPLPQIAELARRYDATLMIDDAHGFGVLGVNGGGCVQHFHLSNDDVPVLMGTLGKAFGVFGAFVAGSNDLIEYLIQTARSYIYTTALPPAVAQATRASLRIVREENHRREHLQKMIGIFRSAMQREGVSLSSSITPIQPIILGENEATMRASEYLYQQGILVTAIRPPTVPKGSARLRITFSASHTEPQVHRLCETLVAALRKAQ